MTEPPLQANPPTVREDPEPSSLVAILDRIEPPDQEAVKIETIMAGLGNRAVGPVLFLLGLIIASPLSAIPGANYLLAVGIIVAAIAQLRRQRGIRLPARVGQVTVPAGRLGKIIRVIRPAAARIDRILKPRLSILMMPPLSRLLPVLALVLGLAIFPLSLIPLAAVPAGISIALIGLALTTRDGAVAITGIAFAVLIFVGPVVVVTD